MNEEAQSKRLRVRSINRRLGVCVCVWLVLLDECRGAAEVAHVRGWVRLLERARECLSRSLFFFFFFFSLVPRLFSSRC